MFRPFKIPTKSSPKKNPRVNLKEHQSIEGLSSTWSMSDLDQYEVCIENGVNTNLREFVDNLEAKLQDLIKKNIELSTKLEQNNVWIENLTKTLDKKNQKINKLFDLLLNRHMYINVLKNELGEEFYTNEDDKKILKETLMNIKEKLINNLDKYDGIKISNRDELSVLVSKHNFTDVTIFFREPDCMESQLMEKQREILELKAKHEVNTTMIKNLQNNFELSKKENLTLKQDLEEKKETILKLQEGLNTKSNSEISTQKTKLPQRILQILQDSLTEKEEYIHKMLQAVIEESTKQKSKHRSKSKDRKEDQLLKANRILQKAIGEKEEAMDFMKKALLTSVDFSTKF